MSMVSEACMDAGIISRHPEIVSGQAVFPGTRILVRTLQDYLATGSSTREFLLDYPDLSEEQVMKVVDLAFNRAIGPRDEDSV